tara:strand:+ start:1466 stop:1822 length:357 start_codon:yes stop_codon:yes gene_type:complete
MKRALALLVLVLACLHEFAWLAVPYEFQGDVRAITQWPLVTCLCIVCALAMWDRFVTACCLAVGLMSSTTAICSAAWLVAPWPIEPGAEQCSTHWGVPLLLVSGLAALLVIISGKSDG